MRNRSRVAAIVVTLFAVASCVTVPSPSGSSSDPSTTPAVDGEGADAGEGTEEPSETAEIAQDAGTTPVPTDLALAGQLFTRLLAAGDQSAVRVPATVAITSESVFQDVWLAIHANQGEPPAVPEVDFGSETVLVVILGERPTAGYSVSIVQIRKTAGRVEAMVQVRLPRAGAMTASVLTSHFEITAVEVAGEPISFVGDDITEGFDTE